MCSNGFKSDISNMQFKTEILIALNFDFEDAFMNYSYLILLKNVLYR